MNLRETFQVESLALLAISSRCALLLSNLSPINAEAGQKMYLSENRKKRASGVKFFRSIGAAEIQHVHKRR